MYDKLAEFVDGLFFYYNNLCSPALLQMASNHAKCVDVRRDDNNWSDCSHIHAGHLSLQRCMEWADEIRPKTVLIFDEDQAPPDRFDEDMDRWDDSGQPSLKMKWTWCWGDLSTVIGQYACPCVWFTQGYRWAPGLSSVLPSAGNSIPLLRGAYHCKYPGRNLGVMTEEIRAWRTAKKNGGGWWLNEPFKLAPYDPALTLNEMNIRDMPTELDRIFYRHGSDKWRHKFGAVYESNTGGVRQPTILEIGVKRGASLLAWAEYFPGAKVIGVDLVRCDVPGATVLVGNQADTDFMAKVATHGPFDFVVDDGSHNPADQLASFNALWQHVKPGGKYFIEDGESSGKGWPDIDATVVHRYKNILVIEK